MSRCVVSSGDGTHRCAIPTGQERSNKRSPLHRPLPGRLALPQNHRMAEGARPALTLAPSPGQAPDAAKGRKRLTHLGRLAALNTARPSQGDATRPYPWPWDEPIVAWLRPRLAPWEDNRERSTQRHDIACLCRCLMGFAASSHLSKSSTQSSSGAFSSRRLSMRCDRVNRPKHTVRPSHVKNTPQEEIVLHLPGRSVFSAIRRHPGLITTSVASR